MNKLFLTTAIILGLGLSVPAYAHGDEDHTGDHAEVTKEAGASVSSSASTAQEALVEVQTIMSAINEQIASGNLDAVHAEIEKIEASSKILAEKSGLEADKKARLDAALKQLNTQLGKVHEATDAKDAAKSESEFKKAQGALKLIEASLK
jgi:hypothetical protein